MPWADLVDILLTIWTHVLALSDSIGVFLGTTFELDGVSYTYLSVLFGAGFVAYLGYVIFKWFVPV